MQKRDFNGKRLKDARLFRGLTLTKLAEKTGISKQSLSLYENGKNSPDYVKARVLASTLGFPNEFLLQQDPWDTSTEVTYFRSLSSATKMSRISLSTKLEYVAKMYQTLLTYIEFPEPNLPEISFDGSDDDLDEAEVNDTQRQIEEIAQQVRTFWNIGDGPIDNLQLLLEKNGIIVTGFSCNDERIDAFSQRTTLNKDDLYLIAVVVGRKPEVRIRFDMAHELGHILLHPWSESLELITKQEFRSRETQANMFASSFLLPKRSFSDDVMAYPTDLDYYVHLKKKWKVSVQAMAYRSHQLGLITGNQFQYMMRQISKKGWRKKEPGDSPYYLNDNVFQSAIDLLIEEGVLSPEGIRSGSN